MCGMTDALLEISVSFETARIKKKNTHSLENAKNLCMCDVNIATACTQHNGDAYLNVGLTVSIPRPSTTGFFILNN